MVGAHRYLIFESGYTREQRMGKTSNLSPDLHQIILRIYDTAADPSVWQNVLNEIVDSVGAQGSVVFEWKDQDGNKALTAPFYSSFYSEEALGLYIDKCLSLIHI